MAALDAFSNEANPWSSGLIPRYRTWGTARRTVQLVSACSEDIEVCDFIYLGSVVHGLQTRKSVDRLARQQ